MSTPKAIIQTAIISLAFFLILFIVSTTNYFTNQAGFKLDALQVFVALIPFVVWLIVSGRLKEIKGPGGIELLMRDEVQKSISLDLTAMPLEVDPAIVEVKGGLEELQNRIAQNPPTTLSFEIGKKNYYGQSAINKYIQELEKHPDFRFILFTDAHRKFKGCMTVSDYKNLLQTGDIVQKLESGQILNDPKVIKNSIKITSTNKQALTEMEKANENKLAVVDTEEKFVGVVTQDEIVRKILTKVLREA